MKGSHFRRLLFLFLDFYHFLGFCLLHLWL
jgi:hypothetical protein